MKVFVEIKSLENKIITNFKKKFVKLFSRQNYDILLVFAHPHRSWIKRSELFRLGRVTR